MKTIAQIAAETALHRNTISHRAMRLGIKGIRITDVGRGVRAFNEREVKKIVEFRTKKLK